MLHGPARVHTHYCYRIPRSGLADLQSAPPPKKTQYFFNTSATALRLARQEHGPVPLGLLLAMVENKEQVRRTPLVPERRQSRPRRSTALAGCCCTPPVP